MHKQIQRILFAAALTAGLIPAQVPKGQGYVYQGFTSRYSDGVGHTGGGGEGVLYKGISIGAEIGALYPFEDVRSLIGHFDINGGYHFTAGRKDTKWDPFVSGGYTLFFRSGSASGYNYGGGVTYWIKPRFGIRAEFRDHRIGREGGYPEIRFGVSFH